MIVMRAWFVSQFQSKIWFLVVGGIETQFYPFSAIREINGFAGYSLSVHLMIGVVAARVILGH